MLLTVERARRVEEEVEVGYNFKENDWERSS